jgi:hypothetical protein
MDAGYSDWGFSDFPQFLQANVGIVPWYRPRPLPATSFPTFVSINRTNIRRYVILASDSVVNGIKTE